MSIFKFLAALVLVFALVGFGQAGDFDYSEVIEKSLLFYEAQRSGKLPSNNRIPWRGDSMLTDSDGSIDLSGGYHDAGDYVKFNFPQASALTALAFGGIDFRAGYESAGQLGYLRDALKWGADYYIKCHTQANELYVQVGDPEADHNSWDRPEVWTGARPAYKITTAKPGSDIAGETAAFLAATSIVFRDVDNQYSQLLLTHARQLYSFAMNFTGKYSDSVPEATPFYTSWSYEDELAWAGAWLYRATNESAYLTEAEKVYTDNNMQWQSGFSWDGKVSGVDVLLAEATKKQVYLEKLTDFCNYAVDEQPRTPKGLVFFSEWGSLRSAANNIFICLQTARLGLNAPKYNLFGKQQIDLMLGDWGRSFVVGFGNNPPSREHHRAASCPAPPAECGWNVFDLPDPNPHVLNGALVGGPGENDEYEDKRNDAIRNEVAVDYNAAFQGCLAALQELKVKS